MDEITKVANNNYLKRLSSNHKDQQFKLIPGGSGIGKSYNYDQQIDEYHAKVRIGVHVAIAVSLIDNTLNFIELYCLDNVIKEILRSHFKEKGRSLKAVNIHIDKYQRYIDYVHHYKKYHERTPASSLRICYKKLVLLCIVRYTKVRRITQQTVRRDFCYLVGLPLAMLSEQMNYSLSQRKIALGGGKILRPFMDTTKEHLLTSPKKEDDIYNIIYQIDKKKSYLSSEKQIKWCLSDIFHDVKDNAQFSKLVLCDDNITHLLESAIFHCADEYANIDH
ncbi:10654_t:CDS:2 [Funneliformis mosseae]|uniref:10654_t:CDS:1 n=1 Tax=Funneliformis mosseae TaxID=27381 RepID=A0A9N9A7Q2_FUNMO|nr:10654_t:CDS:2 [Funneliformis mosseae]